MEIDDQDKLLALLNQNRERLHAQPGVARTSISLGRGGSPVIKVRYKPGEMTDQSCQQISSIVRGAPIEFEELDPNEVIRPQD